MVVCLLVLPHFTAFSMRSQLNLLTVQTCFLDKTCFGNSQLHVCLQNTTRSVDVAQHGNTNLQQQADVSHYRRLNGRAKCEQALLDSTVSWFSFLSLSSAMAAAAAAMTMTYGHPARNTPSAGATACAWHMVWVSMSMYVLFGFALLLPILHALQVDDNTFLGDLRVALAWFTD